MEIQTIDASLLAKMFLSGKNNEAILFEIEKEKEHLKKQIDEQVLSGMVTYWLGQLDALERMRLMIIRYYGG